MSIRHSQPRSTATPTRAGESVVGTSTIAAIAPRTFTYRNTERLQNLIDECNAAIVSASVDRND